MRVFELARQLGVRSKELVEYLGLGSHMEEVSEGDEVRATVKFGGGEAVSDVRGELAFDYREDYALALKGGVKVLVQGGAYFSYGEAGDFDMVSSRHRIVPEPRFLGWVE